MKPSDATTQHSNTPLLQYRTCAVFFVAFLSIGAFALRIDADISYERSPDRLSIVGFPEERPATMETILAADRKNGWGRVTYDAATDTYTVDAHIWIGDDRSNGTFVQIGDKKHPNVTVIVKGTVWVRPPKESPMRSDGRPCVINRLTLGDPEDDNIHATLKIDCDTPGQHGLYVGYRPFAGGPWLRRGSLHVYNSTVTAARRDKEHLWGVRDYTDKNAALRWGLPGWYGSDIRVINSVISWFEGCITYGMTSGDWGEAGDVYGIGPNDNVIIEGTTFEHAEQAVRNGTHYLRNCIFRNMKVAVAEGGALSAKLVGCTFEGNEKNWTLGSTGSTGIVVVDCKVGPQTAPLAIRKNKIKAEDAARRHVPVYPVYVVRESLVVKVTDRAGKPVPGAFVIVTCDEAPGEVTRGATMTNRAGLTPSDPEDGAIVLTVKKYQATDEPEKPTLRTFEYRVAVTAQGFKPKGVTLPAGRSFDRPLVVSLEK